MKLFHQTGHNYKWNLQSYENDGIGDGFILSPLNMTHEELQGLSPQIKTMSFFDPQLYRPGDRKGDLSTYAYFPANIKSSFSTSDFEKLKEQIAEKCVALQMENGFGKVVIPTRHFERERSNYIEEFAESIIDPFLNEISKYDKKPVLLTVIVNDGKLCDETSRNILLDWITGIKGIDGIYLIFNFPRNTKQIKDANLLSEALYFVHSLRQNELEVYIGYVNTEALLYSLAFPNCVTCGSYENLRYFTITRFKTQEEGSQQGPKARLYSSALFQWIEHTYISPIQQLYDKWQTIFSDSKYRPLMFTPEFNWHFQKPELYKHYFIELSRQIASLPKAYEDRKRHVINKINTAIAAFDEINEAGVILDQNNDGTHLNHWLTAINLFEKKLKERR